MPKRRKQITPQFAFGPQVALASPPFSPPPEEPKEEGFETVACK
jgi:hypothetical protein